MKNIFQLFAAPALLACLCLPARAQTGTTGPTPKTRFFETIAEEHKYDPVAHAKAEPSKVEKTQAPAPADPDDTGKNTASVSEPPKPDVILEPMVVTAKRDPFIQIELARTDNLIAVLEEKLKVSRFEEVINNPKIKLPLLGGMTYDMRVATVRADIASLQRRQAYLRLMQVAQTPEEYQHLYVMWHRMRYGKEAPASKIRKLMNSDAIKSRFAAASTPAIGDSPEQPRARPLE